MSPAAAREGVAQGLGYRRTGHGSAGYGSGFRVALTFVDAHPEHRQDSYPGVCAKPGAQHDQQLAPHLTCDYHH
jgi:hypothetical protein